jgi:tetratricopeptide (TPR) repeat protein
MARIFAGDCEHAMADAEKAIALEPDFPSGYSARALCRGDAGDLDGALSDANRAIELGRADFFGFYTRGLVYLERGDLPKARSDLGRAIELAPTAEAAEDVRVLMAEYGLD